MSQRSRWTWGTAVATVTMFAGMFALSVKGTAASGDDDSQSKIQRGFDIAPVPLNLTGKNRALVGMGSYLVQAIFQRDFAVVQAAVLLMALAVLLANLVTDLACAWLDPRIKYG